jgi:hypothetical protein
MSDDTWAGRVERLQREIDELLGVSNHGLVCAMKRLFAEAKRRRGGRPFTGNAMTPAGRQRKHRAKLREEALREWPTWPVVPV